MVSIEVILYSVKYKTDFIIFDCCYQKWNVHKSIEAYLTTSQQYCHLSPYPLKLVTFYIIPIILMFWGKMLKQLMYGGNNFWHICVQIIPDDNSEKITKIDAHLKKLSARWYARRDDMPPPIAANLRACLDGSAVRTALVAWPRCCAPSWPRWDRQTDGRIEVSLNAPYGGGRNKSTPKLSAELRTSFGLHCDKVDALTCDKLDRSQYRRRSTNWTPAQTHSNHS